VVAVVVVDVVVVAVIVMRVAVDCVEVDDVMVIRIGYRLRTENKGWSRCHGKTRLSESKTTGVSRELETHIEGVRLLG